MFKVNKIKISILAIAMFLIAMVFFVSNTKSLENKNIQNLLDGFSKYTHPEIGFSLQYPKDLEIKYFKEQDGEETIVFQKNGDKQEWPAQEKTGFQIFVIPFENDEKELTKEKILKDLPGIIIEDLVEVVIGEKTGRPIHAFVFWSNSDKIGKTREVWFTDGGYLFEITTYEHLDGWLAQIMSTWGFEEK